MNSAQFTVVDTPVIPVQDHRRSLDARPRGMRVRSIGSFAVSFGRLPVHSMGGRKAGANQALGLFAFLFDRGSRGLEKDEAVEVIWPDASISVADTAFHRTLLGLRGSLAAGGFGDAIEFRNGRYVLASGLISWSDTWELQRNVAASALTDDVADRIELLEACRQLNQADYMDDCPFFGTSVFVEPPRAVFRAVRHAVLVELSGLYESRGRHALAALRDAEASGVNGFAGRES